MTPFGNDTNFMDPFPSSRSMVPRGMRDFMEPMGRTVESFQRMNTNPLLNADFSEDKTSFRVHCDMPGVRPEDLNVEIDDDNCLLVTGERHEEKTEDNEARNYHRRERSFGRFSRTIQLPNLIDKDNVDCCFERGCLDICLPKLTKKSPNYKKITIK